MSVNNISLCVLVSLFILFLDPIDADVQDRYAEALLKVLIENVCLFFEIPFLGQKSSC